MDIHTTLADANTVEALFQAILGRPIGNEAFRNASDNVADIHYWIHRLINSEEFRQTFAARHGVKGLHSDYIPDELYRTPSFSSLHGARVNALVVGSCLTNPWKLLVESAYPNVRISHQTFYNASELEDLPDEILHGFDFQILQIPIRPLFAEAEYFPVNLSDEGRTQTEQQFRTTVMRLHRNLDAALKYNRLIGLPTFVLNFARPQANPLGRLLPKYELSNFSYFIEELNRELYRLIQKENSVYMIDYDEISATLGRRFVQDDLTSHLNHGAFAFPTHGPHDIYLTPSGSIEDLYGSKAREAALAMFNECLAAYRILTPDNKIKIVIFDLDGTLWRGVPAEGGDLGPHLTEGWPLSIVEAAAFLKKRGVLLALASKNDPETARRIWRELYEKRFPLSCFVSTKFSWDSKINSIAEILKETNLLAENCLFVDDNPREREQVQAAFPTIKALGGPIYNWRRMLLWGTELQAPYVTQESLARTESIQSVMQREAIRNELDEEDYLRNLRVVVRLVEIDRLDHKRFARAFELLNKTNQFNTTGKRWTEQEVARHFETGGRMLAADVSDRLTDYGLTLILLHHGGSCEQMVMSCRVFGLRVEFAVMDAFLSSNDAPHRLLFCNSGKNHLCRNFMEKLGLPVTDEIIVGAPSIFTFPAHRHSLKNLTTSVRVETALDDVLC